MRSTQASVKVHDAYCRISGQPLREVRYDLVDSQPAHYHSDAYEPSQTWQKRVTLSRAWLQRRTALTGRALLDLEEKIDMSVVELLEKSVPTTCGGFLL